VINTDEEVPLDACYFVYAGHIIGACSELTIENKTLVFQVMVEITMF
jgi:hypothetical protein